MIGTIGAQTFQVNLDQGWNVVSGPEAFDLEQVKNKCSIEPVGGEDVWGFSNGSWVHHEELRASLGYYVFSESSCNVEVDPTGGKSGVNLGEGWSLISASKDMNWKCSGQGPSSGLWQLEGSEWSKLSSFSDLDEYGGAWAKISDGCRSEKAETGSDSGSVDIDWNASGSPPMNGYWYKGYFFEWSPIHDRVSWPGYTEELVNKLGEPSVLGMDVGSVDWTSMQGITQEANKLDAVSKWENKENLKEGSVYNKEERYVYYIQWFFPKDVRNDLGREAAYQKAADGDYNDYYRSFAERLKKHGLSDQVIIRLHAEHNGDWQAYAGDGNEQLFREAWRQYHDTVTGVDQDIMLGYSPSITHSKEIAREAYPGDEYVDYLVLSGIHDGGYPLYVEEDHSECDNDREYPDVSEECAEVLWNEAWDYYKNNQFGLEDASDFARKHELPMAFGEWGLKYKKGSASEWMGGDNPRFIRSMYQWMKEHNVHWQTEFEAKGKEWHLASGNVPESFQAYQETFAKGSETDWISTYRERNSSQSGGEEGDQTDSNSTSGDSGQHNFIFVNKDGLETQKQRVESGKQPWSTSYDRMIGDAEDALSMSFVSVQDDDNDPSYARENDRHDYSAAIKMSEAARDCGLAYWFTGKDKYAECTVDVIHHWTLDSDTYMKPTVGIENNGVTIEQHITIPAFLYGASFVRGHDAWNDYDGSKPWESGTEKGAEAAFKEWVEDRYQTFEPSQPTFCEYNNKWAWRIADRAATAAYLQNDEYMQKAKQMFRAESETTCPDGSTRLRPWNDYRNVEYQHRTYRDRDPRPSENALFKHEQNRDDGFGYTGYNLKAFASAATVFESYDGSNLWKFNAPQDDYEGPSLWKAFNWYSPFVKDTSAWEWNSDGEGITADKVEGQAATYELAYSQWGDFKQVLDEPGLTGGRPHYDGRLLGHVTLTHGSP